MRYHLENTDKEQGVVSSGFMIFICEANWAKEPKITELPTSVCCYQYTFIVVTSQSKDVIS